jgi:ABC-type multidrug transport system ATPase subunit
MLSISLICLLDLLILEILLLDEPTTGLDSCTTRHLVSNLSEIAHRGIR